MKKLLLSTALLFLSVNTFAANPDKCDPNTMPKNVKQLKDYMMIANNDSSIPASEAFSGSDLRYRLKAKPTDKHNKIQINKDTGEIMVKAKAEDKFNVIVIAKNQCGHADAKFNIVIDKE
jgi:hypothetical protein